MVNNGLEIVSIDIDSITPNSYNPNVVEADVLVKLKSEIADRGMCEPILVRKMGDGYEIVDGEHRWQICKDLGW